MISTIAATFRDIVSYFWPNSQKKILRLVVLLLFILLLSKLVPPKNAAEETVEVDTTPQVTVATVGSLSNSASLSLLGTVRAQSEAAITPEVSGRVTQVPVTLGQSVGAGQIIAQLENASEFASLLQAEGAYDAALAGAAQSDESVAEAENRLQAAQNNAVTTYRSAYSSANGILVTTVDTFFNLPDNREPGLRLDGGPYTLSLNSDRGGLSDSMETWRINSNALSAQSDFSVANQEARASITVIISIIDRLLERIDDEDNTNWTIEGSLVETFKPGLTNARSSLTSTLASLDTAETDITAAERSLESARIAGNTSDVSLAEAQVKQALGSLRSAQAAYEKTILRTPIAGTINELDVQPGDFVGAQAQLALVANNDALEITTFITENNRNKLNVGDTVTIEGSVAGTITNIAPSVNSQTKKIEVKIAAESPDLANGDTLSIQTIPSTETVDTTISIPLSAVKFSATDSLVFFIDEGVIASKSVEVGRVNGSNVIIETGLVSTDVIITDARGLSTGQAVEAIQK